MMVIVLRSACILSLLLLVAPVWVHGQSDKIIAESLAKAGVEFTKI